MNDDARSEATQELLGRKIRALDMSAQDRDRARRLRAPAHVDGVTR